MVILLLLILSFLLLALVLKDQHPWEVSRPVLVEHAHQVKLAVSLRSLSWETSLEGLA